MLDYIFIYWLGVIPLLIFEGYYEGPKVYLFLGGGILVVIFWLVKIFKNSTLKFTKIDIVFITWLFALLTASLFAENPIQSLIGGSYRNQGFIFFLNLFLVGKIVSILNQSKKNLLSKIIAIGVLFETIFVFYQVIWGDTYFDRPLGTIGETNAVSGYLMLGLYFITQNFPRWTAFIMSIPILLTGSRAGTMSYFSFAILGLFGKLRANYLIIAFLGVAALLIFLTTLKPYSIFENRFLLWKIGVESVAQRPLIGYGLESQEAIYKKAFIKNELPLSDLIIDRSHNLFLDVAIWSGFLGLIIFIYWLVLEFRNMDDRVRMAAFLSLLIYASFQPLSVVHWLLFIIILRI